MKSWCFKENTRAHSFLKYIFSLIWRLQRAPTHAVVYPPITAAAHHWDGTHLEGDGQRLVAPPVGGQDRAQKVGAVGPDQLGRVVGDDLGHAAVFVGTQSWHRRRCVRLPAWGAHIVHLPWDRLEAIGRRTEPPTGAGIYGNSHHNSVDYQKEHRSLSSSSLSVFLSLALWEKLGSARRYSLNLSAPANGKWDFVSAHRVSKPSPLQTLVGAFKRHKIYFSGKKNNPWKLDDVLNDKLFFSNFSGEASMRHNAGVAARMRI